MVLTREEATAHATAFLERKGFRVMGSLQGHAWQAGSPVVAHLETIWGMLGSDMHWEVVFDELLSPDGQTNRYDHWVTVHVDSGNGDTWFSPIQ